MPRWSAWRKEGFIMIKLNLIPSAKKEEIKKAYYFRLVLKWGLEILLIFVVFVAMLISINYILKITLNSNAESVIAKNYDQYKEIIKYDQEIQNINSQINGTEKIQKGQIHWSKFFEKINGQFSNKIEIKKIIASNYSVLLSGMADNRDDLIQFKGNLEKESCFSEINLPLSNLVEKVNVEFQIDFKIKKECLK